MATIFLFQVFFSLGLLLATGNLPDVFSLGRAPENNLGFLESRFGEHKGNLPNAAPKLLPPARRPGSRSVGVETSADVAAVVDLRSGKTLFEKRSDAVMPLASFTKLMTAMVVLDLRPDWNKKIEIIESDLRGKPSSLEAGDVVTVKDLFYITLVSSDNTAAVALSRSTGIGPDEFLSAMNAKAEEIGMFKASFADVTGLLPANTATALDVAVMARAAFSRNELHEAVKTEKYSFVPEGKEEKTVVTTDRLLEGILNRGRFRIQGGKTGYIEESGFNFVFEVKGDGAQDLLIVVMGSESHDARFEEAKNLALWAFENFDWER